MEIKLEKVKNANGQSRKAHGLAKIPVEGATFIEQWKIKCSKFDRFDVLVHECCAGSRCV